jgi:chromosome segregation ATPase
MKFLLALLLGSSLSLLADNAPTISTTSLPPGLSLDNKALEGTPSKPEGKETVALTAKIGELQKQLASMGYVLTAIKNQRDEATSRYQDTLIQVQELQTRVLDLQAKTAELQLRCDVMTKQLSEDKKP